MDSAAKTRRGRASKSLFEKDLERRRLISALNAIDLITRQDLPVRQILPSDLDRKMLPGAGYGFVKIAFGIMTCTPYGPSTSCVMFTSPATLISWYASSRVIPLTSTRS